MTAWRQLNLFKGKRQKGEKAPLAHEFKTHVAVADALAVGLNEGWLYTHFPAGELRSKLTAARLKRMGTKPGWPDFLLVDSTGTFHCLELKRGNSPLSDAQLRFRDEMFQRDVPYEVARSFQEAIDILRLWGAIRLTVSA
jgi:hypothetical protein